MKLLNSKPISEKIIIPDIVKNKVTISANCTLTEDEITMFNASIKAVCEDIVKRDISVDDCFAFNIIFTENDSFIIEENSDDSLGHQFQLAIYNMERLRNFNDIDLTLSVFLEELCHYFFRISDEKLVKYRVEEIFKIFHPSFELSKLLKRYKLNGF